VYLGFWLGTGEYLKNLFLDILKSGNSLPKKIAKCTRAILKCGNMLDVYQGKL